MRKFTKLCLASICTFFLSTTLFGFNLSLNLGHENPGYNDAFGGNVMFSWTNVAIETGAALFTYHNEDFNDCFDDAIWAHVNLKYIFGGSGARVFIQGGEFFHYIFEDEDKGIDSEFKFTDWFGGIGFFAGNLNSVYGYASLNYGEFKHFFSNIGIGVALF